MRLRNTKDLVRRETLAILAITVLLGIVIACGDGDGDDGGTVALSGTSISSASAGEHIGEEKTVCGSVVDARWASDLKGNPTFLNFDRPPPEHTFRVVIPGDMRSAFPYQPEGHYRGEDVCATGQIESVDGGIQMNVRSPAQLTIQ